MTDFEHLKSTFDEACKRHVDLMEPYMLRIDAAMSEPEQTAVMRHALAQTFRRRFPLPDGRAWPAPQKDVA